VPSVSEVVSFVLAWLRALPRTVVMAGCAVLLGLVQTVLGLSAAPVWVRVLGACLVAALGLLSEADKLHTKRLEKALAEREAEEAAAAVERSWLRRAQDWLRFWPPPRIDEADMFRLGVRPVSAEPAGGKLAGDPGVDGIGPYVARDVEGKAAAQLRKRGLLLLVGEPASGVTRTAVELARAAGAQRRVLAPRAPAGLRLSMDELAVLDRLGPLVRLVVWLDRVADHAPDGVTVPLLQRCRDASPGSRIVGTLVSTSYAQWQGEQPELAAFFGKPVHLKRLPSVRERADAERLYAGMDFTHGIAAAFTGTGTLLTRLLGGSTECAFEPEGGDCALSRALVEVVVSWRASGTSRGLTRQRAAQLATRRAGDPLDSVESHIDACFSWAGRRVPEGVSLLTERIDHESRTVVEPQAELAEIVASESDTDTEVWIAALDDAEAVGDSDAIGRIGYTAHIHSLWDIAQQAWDRISGPGEPGIDWLRQAERYSANRHHPRGQVPPLQTLLTIEEREYGPDHPEVAATLGNLGNAWSALGKPGKARELYERALTIEEREFGPDHPEVAATLGNLGNAWSELGKPDKARELYQRALAIQRRHYPNGHPRTATLIRSLRTVAPDLVVLDDGRILSEPDTRP